MTITYFDDDSARSITQNGVTTTYDLDPAGRRSTSTTTSTAGTSTTNRYYADGSDNPTWATTNDGVNPEKTTWYGGDIGGALGIEITDNTKTLTLNDPLGSVATTVDITDANQSPTIGLVGTYDEYGITITNPGSTGSLNYSWLGGKERAQDTTGLILMGERLYNNITGHFTSVDPVPGGNTTAYIYPQDPINELDLDGNFSWRKIAKRTGKFLWKHRETIAWTALGFVPVVGVGVRAARLIMGTQRIASNYKKVLYTLRTSSKVGQKGAKFVRTAVRKKARDKAVGTPCPRCGVIMAKPLRNMKGVKKNMKQLEGDHIVARKNGGNNSTLNEQFMCAKCNNRKGSR
ncbi:RHS repeat-associated core domain-containing protein [Jonesiaceae bacterium BS-20]|uniref:RHS repeat-associated core domain-containing protein n=1 Tax=Jonesiaceae bacterium BS-20 TaxID=3120821 RepID=A0AAU7E0C9_9MICO